MVTKGHNIKQVKAIRRGVFYALRRPVSIVFRLDDFGQRFHAFLPFKQNDACVILIIYLQNGALQGRR